MSARGGCCAGPEAGGHLKPKASCEQSGCYRETAMKRTMKVGVVFAILVVMAAVGVWRTVPGRAEAAQVQKPAAGVPMFQVDPYWPKMEGNWTFGDIGGIAVDPENDHLFVVQRPATLEEDESYAA